MKLRYFVGMSHQESAAAWEFHAQPLIALGLRTSLLVLRWKMRTNPRN